MPGGAGAVVLRRVGVPGGGKTGAPTTSPGCRVGRKRWSYNAWECKAGQKRWSYDARGCRVGRERWSYDVWGCRTGGKPVLLRRPRGARRGRKRWSYDVGLPGAARKKDVAVPMFSHHRAGHVIGPPFSHRPKSRDVIGPPLSATRCHTKSLGP